MQHTVKALKSGPADEWRTGRCEHSVAAVSLPEANRVREHQKSTACLPLAVAGAALSKHIRGTLTHAHIQQSTYAASPLLSADFTGRVAIITGAARGLGLATAMRFLERGASVGINVRDETRANAIAASLGPQALALAGDITAKGLPNALVQRTLDKFGRIDILVNNAALALSTRFGDLEADEWRHALETNLTAPFLLTKAVLPTMKAKQYGRIINVSSTAGRTVSTLGGAHYTASKAGLLGLTRAAAKELGKFGITVNAVCPGMIDTELTHENASAERLEQLASTFPVPRLGSAREVADLICFAASEEAGYLTGTSLDINGGDLMM